MDRLYLDWNASAPLRPEAAAAMESAERLHGNPSSIHAEGRALRAFLEQARERIRAALLAPRARIVWTSGATESDNLAILGVAAALERSGTARVASTTAIEHSAVLEPFRRLEERGWRVLRAAPDPSGSVQAAALFAGADPPRLVSCILASNETGALQDVRAVSASARAAPTPVVVHTDATQAIGRVHFSFEALGVSLASVSAHKCGGPRGAGALLVRPGTTLDPLLSGGDQEDGLRAGTPNLGGIAGLVAAIECAVAERERAARSMERLVSRLRATLARRLEGVRFHSPEVGGLPNTLSVSFQNIDGRALLVALDLEGIAASVGSACASGALEPSHVLLAMGLSDDVARGALRLSIGASTSEADVDDAAARIERVVVRLRRSPSRQGS